MGSFVNKSTCNISDFFRAGPNLKTKPEASPASPDLSNHQLRCVPLSEAALPVDHFFAGKVLLRPRDPDLQTS